MINIDIIQQKTWFNQGPLDIQVIQQKLSKALGTARPRSVGKQEESVKVPAVAKEHWMPNARRAAFVVLKVSAANYSHCQNGIAVVANII